MINIRNINKKFLTIIFIFLFTLICCSDCIAADLQTVSIQLKWSHQFQFAGYYAAVEKGFYAEEGLNIILKKRDPDKGHIQSVLEGDAEYGVADAGLVLERLRGNPVVLLKQIFQHSPLILVTLKKSKISSPYHLIDKTIMIDSNVNSEAPIIALLLQTVGDLDSINIVPQSFKLDSLINGEVDALSAYITNEPFTLKKKGIGYNIINPKSYGIDFYGDNFFTTETEIKHHPERVEKMIRATLKGWQYALDNQDEIIDLIIRKYNPELNREKLVYEARLTNLMVLSDLIPLGFLSRDRYEDIVGIYVKAGMAKANQYWDGFLYHIQNNKNKTPLFKSLSHEEKIWLAEHPKIEVGIMSAWPPFGFMDAEGRLKGIGIKLIDILNNKLGNTLVPKPGDWPEIYRAVKEKQLPALLDFTPKKSREQYFNSTRPYLSVPHVIVAQKNKPYLRSEKDLIGKTLALEKGFGNVKYFAKNYPGVIIKKYENTAQALDAVERGETEAYVGNRAVASYIMGKEVLLNLKFHGRLNKEGSVLAIGVRKDWPILKDILQKALDNLTEEEYHTILVPWIQSNEDHKEPQIKLNANEKSWLKAHPIIRVSNLSDYAPFDFIENGKPAGFSIDYVNMLAKRAGLRLKFVQDNWKNLVNMGKEKKIDLLHTIYYTPERARFFKFTRPYKSVINGIYVREDICNINSVKDLANLRVILSMEDAIAKQLPRIVPTAKYIYIESYEEVFKAISLGRGDATVLDTAVANYLIRKNTLTNVVPAAEADISIKDRDPRYRLGIRNDWPELFNILEKAMNTVTRDDMVKLEERWFGNVEITPQFQFLAQPNFDKVKFFIKTLVWIFGILLFALFALWLIKGRPKDLNLQLSYLIFSVLFTGLIITTGILVIFLIQTSQEVNRIEKKFNDARNLAMELTQSSDHLTYLARLFVATGDPKYEFYYNIVIDIRDGKRPHPKRYINSYWHQVISGTKKLDQDGDTYSIKQRMTDLGLSEQEMEKLTLAISESDKLVRIEKSVFKAMHAVMVDSPGITNNQVESNSKEAMDVLFGKAYRNAKTKIMKPIDDFFLLFELRSKNMLQVEYDKRMAVLFSVVLLIVLKILGAAYIFYFTRKRIIKPLNTIQQALVTIQKGDYQHRIIIDSSDEIEELADGYNTMAESIGKQTDQLRKAEEKLRNILEKMPIGTVLLDKNDVVYYRNKRFMELFGYTETEQPNIQEFFSRIYPDLKDRECALKVWKDEVECSLKTDQDILTNEFSCVHKNGEVKHLIATDILLPGGDLLVNIIDITDRKEAEEELKKLSIAVEQSPASVVITDTLGTIEYVNPAFTSVTGYTYEEAVGQNPRLLKSDQHPPEFYEDLWTTICKKEIWHGEMVNKKKDGSLFWENVSISPILNRSGDISRFLAVKNDISDKKEAEEELEKAKEKAEAATRAKSDFLANMSHEIRTPINAIIGMSHLALKTALTSKQFDYITKIDHSGKSLLGIINDILDFSKIEAGKLDVEIIDFNLNDVMHNLSNMISVKTQDKDLELIFNIHPDTPTQLKGDSLRLGQILLNLTNNAVKFTEDGEILITVQPVEVEENKALLKFSVQDTGIGLSESQQRILFQSFQQADTSTSRKFGGTGLGLAISKNLAEIMGGEIGVISEIGKGSTFFFTARFGRHEKNLKKAFVLPEFLTRLNVLVVDDNHTFCLTMKRYLEEFGFSVETINSGIKAIQKIKDTIYDDEKRFDLMFIDWQMPELNGIETFRQIHNQFNLELIPKIILITGFGREDIMKQAIEIPLDGFLLKPVTQSLLFDAIMEAYGQDVERESKRDLIELIIPEGFDDIRGANILVVEDNELNQQVVTEILEQEGFFITIANNGQAALEKIQETTKEQTFDIILMDLQMPIMDGYTATKKIRQNTRFNDLPIIAMTADAMRGVRERTADVGMDDYLAKPINPRSLFNILIKWISPGERGLPEKFEKLKEEARFRDEHLSDLPGTDVQNVTLDMADLSPRIKKLQQYLLDWDMDAISLMEEICQLASGSTFTDVFDRVARHVNAYANEKALAELEKIIEQFDIRL